MSDSPSAKYVLTCPGCQKRFFLPNNSILGKRVTCKSCKAPFIVDGGVLAEFAEYELPANKVVEPSIVAAAAATEPLKPIATQKPSGNANRIALAVAGIIGVISLVLILIVLLTSGDTSQIASQQQPTRPEKLEQPVEKEAPKQENKPQVVERKEEPLAPIVIRNLGVEESTLVAMLQHTEPTIFFKLDSSTENVRNYISKSKVQLLKCIGKPADLKEILVIAPLSIFLIESQREMINDYEATIGKVAFMIKPSLKNDATGWLANRIPHFLLGDEVQATVLRGVVMEIYRFKQGDKMENELLVFQFSAEQ